MNLCPDGQQFKYRQDPKIVIGTSDEIWMCWNFIFLKVNVD